MSHSPYDDALNDMMEDIIPDLQKGVAMNMNQLLQRYQCSLGRYLSADIVEKYTKQKLKSKLLLKYSNEEYICNT